MPDKKAEKSHKGEKLNIKEGYFKISKSKDGADCFKSHWINEFDGKRL